MPRSDHWPRQAPSSGRGCAVCRRDLFDAVLRVFQVEQGFESLLAGDDARQLSTPATLTRLGTLLSRILWTRWRNVYERPGGHWSRNNCRAFGPCYRRSVNIFQRNVLSTRGSLRRVVLGLPRAVAAKRKATRSRERRATLPSFKNATKCKILGLY